MKTLFNFIFIYLFTYSSFSLQAQHRTDVWMLGANCSSVPYPMPAVTFATGNIDTFTITRPSFFFITNTSICDTAGNLLFYTNGVNIFNANHDTLLNSVGFNPGYASNVNCNLLAITQGCMVIPKPYDASKYYIIHVSGEEFTAYNQLQVQPLELRYSIIDMNLDNGLGGILPQYKKSVLISDTLALGMMALCKNGNGRDWWLTIPRFYSNKYYKFLITSDSIFGPFIQSIGNPITYDFGGGALFSNDGTKYAIVSNNNNLNIFSFDRCTGMFSDSTFIQIPNINQSFYESCLGLSISASNQFLYAITLTKIYHTICKQQT